MEVSDMFPEKYLYQRRSGDRMIEIGERLARIIITLGFATLIMVGVTRLLVAIMVTHR